MLRTTLQSDSPPIVCAISARPSRLIAPHPSLAAIRRVVHAADRIGNALLPTKFLKKHLTKREAAFIAAAYAIPLPGTALLAGLMVWSRRLYLRHVAHRLTVSLPDLRRRDEVLLLETGDA